MNVLEQFLMLAEQRGLGVYAPTGTGGTLYLDELPDTPDLAVALARYGGTESDSRLPYDEIAMQWRVRGSHQDRRTAANLAQRIYDELHGMGSRALPGGTWMVDLIGTQGGPVYIGKDPKHRPEWTVNMRAEVHRPTVHRA
ncbi:hypothetical protein SUDANB95_05519 [Actinosynnema sp. ALI-1.44]